MLNDALRPTSNYIKSKRVVAWDVKPLALISFLVNIIILNLCLINSFVGKTVSSHYK
jgi:hypothetical protein